MPRWDVELFQDLVMRISLIFFDYGGYEAADLL